MENKSLFVNVCLRPSCERGFVQGGARSHLVQCSLRASFTAAPTCNRAVIRGTFLWGVDGVKYVLKKCGMACQGGDIPKEG